MSPSQLIRSRAAAMARMVTFVFVKVHQRLHQRWLKLCRAGAIRQRVAADDDDARSVRCNALLAAAGWRAGPHVQTSMQGRGKAASPATRRLLTACNTDWRAQPANAVDVSKAPTAAQVCTEALKRLLTTYYPTSHVPIDHVSTAVSRAPTISKASDACTPHHATVLNLRCKPTSWTSSTTCHTSVNSFGSTRMPRSCWMQDPRCRAVARALA